MITRIESFEELQKLRNELKDKIDLLVIKDHPKSIIQIRVAMATCGIASGARPVYEYLKEELGKRNIPAMVTKTGCMTYCYAEPTVEVTIPGNKPVMFGDVTLKKADEIIERFIRKGETIDGIIPMIFDTIDSYRPESI